MGSMEAARNEFPCLSAATTGRLTSLWNLERKEGFIEAASYTTDTGYYSALDGGSGGTEY